MAKQTSIRTKAPLQVVTFDQGDEPYFRWMELHPNGYVANTGRTPRSPYFVLHRSNCTHIARSGWREPGSFTERTYIKVCAEDLETLRSWGRDNRLVGKRGCSQICASCLPDEVQEPSRGTYAFIPGSKYSRKDVQSIIGVPQTSGGDFYTGYTSHNGDFFVFCGVGAPGRTGHDYENRFIGDDLIWYGKAGSKLRHSQIRDLLDPSTNAYIFFREENRDLFTFAGIGRAMEVVDSSPVQVRWTFGEKGGRGISSLPEEVQDSELLDEGAKKVITVNAYERNPLARERCLSRWGYSCEACGFNFERIYGEIGRGFIHVHHLKPLGEIKGAYLLDPIADLRPICPNCHAMLHQRVPALSITELKDLLRKTRFSTPVD